MAPDIRQHETPHAYITEWRESLHLSQEQLAGRLNVHKSTVSRWENQRRGVKPAALGAIAKALGLDSWRELLRLPADRVSIDAMLAEASDEDFEAVAQLARRLTRHAS